MLEYADFYDIAEYGNKNWKGCFTPKEIAYNAYDYYVEFQESKSNGINHTIKGLMELLLQDKSEEANHWLDMMETELKKKKTWNIKYYYGTEDMR